MGHHYRFTQHRVRIFGVILPLLERTLSLERALGVTAL